VAQLWSSGARAVGWTLVGAALTLVLGCQTDFAGPYPCNTGYASCTTPNSCETSVLDDAQNCGSCGNACPQGALCAMGACTAPPQALATVLDSATLALNASAVFFPAMTKGYGIEGIPKSGGTAYAVATPNAQQAGLMAPFAVDDARIYYLAQNFSSPGGPFLAASPAAPASGAPPQPTVVGTFPTMNGSNFGALTALLRVGGTLFLAANSNGQYVVGSVPTSGGMVAPVATFRGEPQSITVDSTNVYAVVASSGPCEIDSAPVSGGTASTLIGQNVLNGPNSGGCPQGLASDGTRLYWATNYSAYPAGDNGNSPGECTVSVTSAPIGGGPATTLSTVRADEVPLQIATDGTNVYVATNRSLWRFPPGGGAPVRLAGNLDVTMTCGGSNFGSGGCSYVGGACGGNSPVALAVDDTSAYLAIASGQGVGQGGVLLKITK